MPLRHKIFVWNNSYLFSLPAWSMNFHTIHWTSSQWTIHYWTQWFKSHNMYIINAHLEKKKKVKFQKSWQDLQDVKNILQYLHNKLWNIKSELLCCHLFDICSKPHPNPRENELFIPLTTGRHMSLSIRHVVLHYFGRYCRLYRLMFYHLWETFC